MDPLSIAASVLGILGAAQQAVKGVDKLRALKHAKEDFSSLLNELADIQILVTQVNNLSHHLDAKCFEDSVVSLRAFLNRAREQLLELNQLVEYDLSKPQAEAEGGFRMDRLAWALNTSKVSSLQRKLMTTKVNIATVLGVINSTTVTRVELAIQQVKTKQDDTSLFLQQLLHQCIAHDNSIRICGDLAPDDVSTNIPVVKPLDFYPRESHTLPFDQDVAPFVQKKAHAKNRTRICRRWCSCVCHSQRTLRNPEWLRRVAGALFIGYIGLPRSAAHCSESDCRQKSGSAIEVTYHFPVWSFARVLSLRLKMSTYDGPELLLRMPRMVGYGSPLWGLVYTHALSDLQEVFQQREGSPFDVDPNGRSALHLATRCGYLDICTLLIQEGADMNLRDDDGVRPIDTAWEMILSYGMSTSKSRIIAQIFDDSDYVEGREFTPLHKLALGLSASGATVESALELSTAHVNKTDAFRRTCLAWACARGDQATVDTLLRYGADPRITDLQDKSPLVLAARAGATECVAKLVHNGLGFSTRSLYGGHHHPLHVAAVSCEQPEVLKILIEYGEVGINTISRGDTALAAASVQNHVANVRFLLAAGADPDIPNTEGETAIFGAIYGGAHQALRLLVECGANCDIVGSRGRTVLHALAETFDPERLHAMKGATFKEVNFTTTDDDGRTCLDILQSNPDNSAAHLVMLREFLAGVEAQSDDNDDFFEDAAEALC